jgi:hypothetical protein
MDWIRSLGKKKSSVRRSSHKKRPSSTKNNARVVFVKGHAKTAYPKQGSSGHYYVRKDSTGKSHKVSIVGRTYSRQEAQKKVASARKK